MSEGAPEAAEKKRRILFKVNIVYNHEQWNDKHQKVLVIKKLLLSHKIANIIQQY